MGLGPDGLGPDGLGLGLGPDGLGGLSFVNDITLETILIVKNK